MDDARRTLEAAAEARVAVDVLPRQGAATRGQVVRVERGGVVLSLAGTVPPVGTDLRCWLTVDGVPYTFEASVLRAGVPVPDRGQGGVMVGFVDGWTRGSTQSAGLALTALPAGGGAVSLVDGEVRVVDLHPDEWLVSAPAGFPLVFVEGGKLRLSMATAGRAPVEVGATVRDVSRAVDHILYRLAIDEVQAADRYREAVAAARSALGL